MKCAGAAIFDFEKVVLSEFVLVGLCIEYLAYTESFKCATVFLNSCNGWTQYISFVGEKKLKLGHCLGEPFCCAPANISLKLQFVEQKNLQYAKAAI